MIVYIVCDRDSCKYYDAFPTMEEAKTFKNRLDPLEGVSLKIIIKALR